MYRKIPVLVFTFTLCTAAPYLFCFEAICDRYFFKLNFFKPIGWFNHCNVFPSIRSVCYRFLHCDYRKMRKLHFCLGLTALKSTNHSRVKCLCILLYSYVIVLFQVQFRKNMHEWVFQRCRNGIIYLRMHLRHLISLQ
jgi:hypothetical protein